MKEYIQVVTTLDDEDKARSLAREVVKARVVACAQVLGPISSIYWWQGELEETGEYMVVMKTVKGCYPRLEKLIKERHSYTVPEILAFPVVVGNEEYLEWLEEETEEGAGG